jgi:disulfide bond formation protein DsbB
MAISQSRVRDLLAGVVIVLIAVPGVAAWLGMVEGESPCILCWAQRTSMVLIALVGLFILRYGPRLRYIGTAVLLAAFGVFMALRHSGLHLARDVGQGFAAPYFGVHTYAWSWFIHWTVLLTIGVLLLLLREAGAADWGTGLNRPGRFAAGWFMVVVGANAFQAFASTGPPPFIGQADPVRFSLNPRHWVWGWDEIHGRVSLRGSWTIPKPDPAAPAADPNPAHGPLTALPALAVTRWEQIGAPLEGALTDLAHDAGTGRFLAVTDRYDVYLLDSTLSQVLRHVRLDPGFSVDLSPLAGAAFLEGDTLAVLSTNKSYALLRPDAAADPRAEWRHFLLTEGGVTELRLGRFATVRARQMYVLSLAYDPAARELITVTVPSPRQRRLVVSRFARADFLPASEFEPHVGAELAPAGADSALAGYVVTGAAVADGLLYAISAAYSTLLVLDLTDRTVHAAYRVPDVTRPTGLAVREAQLLVAQADGRVAVLERPSSSHR